MNTNQIIQITTLVAYIIAMAVIAIISRKKNKTLSDFFFGGHGIGGWLSAFAYGTTYFSAVAFIGYAGRFGWQMGLSAMWIGVANAIVGSLLAWRVLAVRTKVMMVNLQARTLPEFFEKRYDDNKIKLVSALIIFVFLIPYSASAYQGIAYIFEEVFKINFIWCVLAMALITSLYLFFGGYFATALSDLVQGFIMIFGIFLMVLFMVKHPNVGGLSGLKNLSAQGFGFVASGKGGLQSPLFNLIVISILTSVGVWAVPQSIHKFCAIRDYKAIRKGKVISTVFCFIIGAGAYFVGGLSRLFINEMPQGGYDAIIPEILDMALPAALLGVIVVLVLSASMSTLSSLSLAGASAAAIDAYKGYIKPKASGKEVNILLRVLCLLFILISVLLAVFKVKAIVTLMGLSWGVLAGCFIGPYVLGLYFKKITKQAAWASIIGGLIVTVILIIVFGFHQTIGTERTFASVIDRGVSQSPFIGVLTMAHSLIITPLVSYLTRNKLNSQKADEIFNDYQNKELEFKSINK